MILAACLRVFLPSLKLIVVDTPQNPTVTVTIYIIVCIIALQVEILLTLLNTFDIF